MKTSIIHAALFTPRSGNRWGLPLVLWGDPGIAKTSIIKMLAKQAGFHCEHLAPGERGEGAFGVTPVPAVGSNGTVLEYPPPDWVRKLITPDGTEAGVVFLDELNCLTGDTTVTTVGDNGNYRERQIRDMLPGDHVVSFDLQSGRRCANRVSHVQHMPASLVVSMQLADGRSIRATPNHRFYVDGKWVFAADLRPGTRLHIMPDMQETLQSADSNTSEGTRNVYDNVSRTLPEGSVDGARAEYRTRGQGSGSAKVEDAGPRVCSTEAGRGSAFGRVPGQAIIRGECGNSNKERQYIPRAVFASAKINAGAASAYAGAGGAPRPVFAGRQSYGQVLAFQRRAPVGIRTGQAQLGEPGLQREYSQEEFSARNLRPYSSNLQECKTYDSRATDDRLRPQVGSASDLCGGRDATCRHTKGRSSALAQPGLLDQRGTEYSDPVRSINTIESRRRTGRLYSSGVECVTHIDEGSSQGRTTLSEVDGPHCIVEIVSIKTIPYDGEVWDLSVEIGHNFYANGILTHNTAPPALQPALLGAIQEGRIGGHEFGPRVRMIGAANPVGQAAGGWDLAPPVANRLGHIDWPAPEVDEWSTWLLAGDEHLETFSALAEEERVMKRWPLAFAKASGLATAFLRRRPNLLHKMPEEGDPTSSRAWASPRSWEHAVRARAGAEVHGLTAIETDEFIAAFIGAAAAGEWGQWIDEADLPDPNDVLDGKVKYKHDPERLDRTMAVLASCAALITPVKAEKRKARSKAMWELMSVIMEDAKDVVVPAMQAMVRAKLQRTAEARPVLAKMHSVVSAAGMTAGGGSR